MQRADKYLIALAILVALLGISYRALPDLHTTTDGQPCLSVFHIHLHLDGQTVRFSTSEGIIGIREENKRVFVLPNPTSAESEEYLAYDFNLTVGDTVPDPYYYQTPGGPSDYNLVIHTIDSIFISGTWRKRYQINSFPDIIEGVGSSSGLLNPLNYAWSGACGISLNCYIEQGVSDYFTSNCELPSSGPSSPATSQSRELLKVVDSMGREQRAAPNTLLFYIYSNGDVEKVVRVE